MDVALLWQGRRNCPRHLADQREKSTDVADLLSDQEVSNGRRGHGGSVTCPPLYSLPPSPIPLGMRGWGGGVVGGGGGMLKELV